MSYELSNGHLEALKELERGPMDICDFHEGLIARGVKVPPLLWWGLIDNKGGDIVLTDEGKAYIKSAEEGVGRNSHLRPEPSAQTGDEG